MYRQMVLVVRILCVLLLCNGTSQEDVNVLFTDVTPAQGNVVQCLCT